MVRNSIKSRAIRRHNLTPTIMHSSALGIWRVNKASYRAKLFAKAIISIVRKINNLLPLYRQNARNSSRPLLLNFTANNIF